MDRLIARLCIGSTVVLLVGCVHLDRPPELEAYLEDRMKRAGIPGMAVGIMMDGGRINLRSLKSLLDILKRLCAEAGMV